MSSNPALPNSETQAYLSQQQCSRQWRGFLRAISAEFASALPDDELRDLMHRIGMKFAVQNPLPACETLTLLQEEMTSFWKQIDWGWVTLTQDARCLNIDHCCAPLASAFGTDQGDWMHGFLQGVYQQWFDSAGAQRLRVSPAVNADTWGSVRFELSL